MKYGPLFGAFSLLGGGGLLAWLAFRSNEEGEPASPTLAPPASGPSGIPLTENEFDALARVVASEAGSGTTAEQRAVGWTVRNRFRGKSIYASEYPWRAQKGANPPFSSARPANESHRKLAAEILAADQSADPTGGATSFFEPRMQDAFAKAGALARAGETGDRVIDGIKITDITRFKNYHLDADGVRAKWSKGSTLYARAGRFEFWGSASKFAKRGGEVQTISGVDFLGASAPPFMPACTVVGFDSGPTCRERLSRMLATNGARATDAERRAMAWATRNRAAALGIDVRDLLSPETGYASTRLPETEWSRVIANSVMSAPASADPTRGAIDFWRPDLQPIVGAFAGLHAAAVESGDDETAARYVAFAGNAATEAEARARLAANGLRAIGTVGRVELLGVFDVA